MKEFVLKYKYMFIAVFVLVFILIGGTYAWVNIEIFGTKTQKIVSGSLVMELDESTCTEINITNAYPISDVDGMKQVACTFTLVNTGTLNSGYNLYLDDVEIDSSLSRMSDSDVKIGLVKNSDSPIIKLVSEVGVNPNRIIDSGVLAVGGSNTYELRLWIDIDAGNDAMGKVLSTKLRVSGEVNNSSECFDIPSYGGEPNPPEMIGDMIPVTYDGVNWVKADINNNLESWYNYNEQIWANAVTVTEASRSGYLASEVGTVINDTDINLFLVWIPRYSYTRLDDRGVVGCGREGNKYTGYGAFDIKWINTNTTDLGIASYTGNTAENWFTNSAFCWGNSCDDPATRSNAENREVSGIWAQKLNSNWEYGYDNNLPIWFSRNLSYISTSVSDLLMGANASINYGFSGSSYDAHIIKNTEWGAIAYLMQSRYGSYGNSKYELGDWSQAETTGNQYGVERVSQIYLMANLADTSGNFITEESGFTVEPENKYFNKYLYDRSQNIILNDIKGSGMTEFGNPFEPYSASWILRTNKFSTYGEVGRYIGDMGGQTNIIITP